MFVFGYLGWQLVGTDLVNSRVQAQANEELDEVFESARQDLPEVEQVVPDTGGNEGKPVQYHPEPQPDEGGEFAFMSIPSIGLEAVVFEGVDRETLTQGPGHMPGTPLPGQPGNAVLSGHRTTHGRPFWDFDLLQQGDRIEVETAIGVHVYEVVEWFIVEPTDVWVTNPKDGAWLTLTTCNPKFSARERLIVSAQLVSGPNLDYVDYVTGL